MVGLWVRVLFGGLDLVLFMWLLGQDLVLFGVSVGICTCGLWCCFVFSCLVVWFVGCLESRFWILFCVCVLG